MKLVLASTSPRRIDLLTQAGVCFDTLSAEIDEQLNPNETPQTYSQRMVLSKAQKACTLLNHELTMLITADTILMWDKLSGKTHTILTAVCASVVKNRQIITQKIIKSQTEVTFITLTDAQKQWYWQTGEPKDKAGAYAIQGIGGAWVEKINGSYTAVVGLPLAQTLALINQMTKDYV